MIVKNEVGIFFLPGTERWEKREAGVTKTSFKRQIVEIQYMF